jgi:putative modified peptide
MAKNFSRDVADKLLDKLSSDDDFRDLFQKDPRAAVAKVGHVTPEADVGKAGVDPVMCLSGAKLASKEDIRKARGKLQDQLSSSAFHYTVEL